MKKKTLWLTLILASLALISCGGAESTPKNPKIGLAIYRFDDAFMANFKRILEEAAKDKTVLTVADGQNQQMMQNDQVDTFLAQGMQSLIVNPVDRMSAGLLISKAEKAEVPIIFINREPDPSDLVKWDKAFYVGAHESDSGHMSAEIILDYWKNNPKADLNGDGILQYVVLMGEPAHQDTIERTASYRETFATSQIKTQEVIRDYARWDRSTATEKMRSFITYAQSHNLPIEAVLANNDEMALGAIEALKREGSFKDDQFIPVVGVDASRPALDSMEKGELLGSPFNNTQAQGIASFEIAYALAQGTPVHLSVGELTGVDGQGQGNYVWIPYEKVTQKNWKTIVKNL